MDKRKWSWKRNENLVAGIALLVVTLGCGYLLQFAADSPAAVTALTSRATR
jgi:hypothetical protein